MCRPFLIIFPVLNISLNSTLYHLYFISNSFGTQVYLFYDLISLFSGLCGSVGEMESLVPGDQSGTLDTGQDCTLHTAHCTLHTAHCTLHTVRYTLHTTHCTLHIAHCILYTAHYTLHTTHYTLHTEYCTLHT